MNWILFSAAFVGIFCMTASSVFFNTDFFSGEPPLPALVKSCLLKQRTLEKTCTDPALVRWNLTDLATIKHLPDVGHICCMTFDVLECQIRTIPKEPCNSTEQKAFIEYNKVLLKWAADDQCPLHPRSSCNL